MKEIKQRVNKPALEEVLRARSMKQAELAEKIGAPIKSFNRWINEGYIQSQYVWDMTETLELSEEDLDKVLFVPKYQVFFRKKFLGEVPEHIQERAIELARTLFGLTYLNANAKFCPPNVSKIDDPLEVANQIRKYLEIESFNSLQGIVAMLAEQGVEVALIPFAKLELNSTGDHEQAFSVTDGSRFLIFLDADSPEERLIFNLCHELCHVFRPDLEFSKIEETFCNDVASELVYPREFFIEHKDKIERVIASSSVESIISLISVIRDNLGGEAFGISLRLKALGFLSQKNRVHQKVIGYGKRSFENLKNISDRYFSDFDQNDKEKFVKFWNGDRINKNPLLRFFSHLKSGATDESISPRKFSELLGVDLSIADEMIRKWRFELHQALKEAENE